ncbi:MAG: PspA/IM30 family protein [Lentisphaeraceae bacterium]|nr:PspA/IM30 family protein [Lentisphaeraceae bacterium]
MKILDRTKNIIESKVKKYESTRRDSEAEYIEALESMQSIIKDLEKSAAAALAEMTIIKKQIEVMEGEQAKWLENAKRAVGAGQDDLARQALLQKKSIAQEIEDCQNFYEQTEASYKYFKNELGMSQEKFSSLKTKLDLLRHKQIMHKAGIISEGKNEDNEKLEREFDKLRKNNELSLSVDEEFQNLKKKLKAK